MFLAARTFAYEWAMRDSMLSLVRKVGWLHQTMSVATAVSAIRQKMAGSVVLGVGGPIFWQTQALLVRSAFTAISKSASAATKSGGHSEPTSEKSDSIPYMNLVGRAKRTTAQRMIEATVLRTMTLMERPP